MKPKRLPGTTLFFLFSFALMAQRPWQQITVPSFGEVAANFKAPPHEYGAIQPFASWNGPDPQEVGQRIVRDLDRLAANGIFVVNLSPGRGEPKYLSPEHMDQVKFTVEEAAKRGMRLWIQDESDYPSGFAGGNISRLYPQLGMQGIVADIRVHVVPGQTLTMPVPPDTLAIFATKTSTDQRDSRRRQYSRSVERPAQVDRAGRGLDPQRAAPFLGSGFRAAHLRQFADAEFQSRGRHARQGRPLLAHRLPGSGSHSRLPEDHARDLPAGGGRRVRQNRSGLFRRRAGLQQRHSLDAQTAGGISAAERLRPEALHAFVLPRQRAGSRKRRGGPRADYSDVWSGIFQNSFFGEQAEWCKKYNVEYLVHLNHEETMIALERSEGDYFRDNRNVRGSGNR